MKKTYQSPHASIYETTLHTIIATSESITINNNEKDAVDPSVSLSRENTNNIWDNIW